MDRVFPVLHWVFPGKIAYLGFVTTSFLDIAHMQRGDVLKKNHDSSLVRR
jgi:hypothetical protein